MKDRSWERPPRERRQVQERKLRGAVLDFYAPMEPALMGAIYRFLLYEKRFPLELVHRVLDRLAAITVMTTVMSHDEILRFIEGIPEEYAIAVGPCACRIHTAEPLGPDARDLASGQFTFCRPSPLNVDVQIGRSGEGFSKLPSYRTITRQELLDLEAECFNMGLVANVYTMMDGESGICHCSSATCVPFLANEAIGGTSAVVRRGAYVSVTDSEACTGRGHCVEVCHFGARRLGSREGGPCVEVNPGKCYGCGICAAACPEKAISLKARRHG